MASPICHTGTNNRSVTALCATPGHVIISMSDRSICALDVRDQERPVLGISLDEYNTNEMFYNEADDSLCLFATASKEGTSDSLLFIDGEGSSRKYIFGKYPKLLHL